MRNATKRQTPLVLTKSYVLNTATRILEQCKLTQNPFNIPFTQTCRVTIHERKPIPPDCQCPSSWCKPKEQKSKRTSSQLRP